VSEIRKITVEVPADLLASAQAYTGKGVTDGQSRIASARVCSGAKRGAEVTRESEVFFSRDEPQHDRE
jgi:hypothetical protein